MNPKLANNLTNGTQYKPKPYQKKRYYTPNDVRRHNTANDVWITLFNEVYDLTDLVQEFIAKSEAQPLIKAAGTDISHWFDPQTRNPRMKVDVKTGLQTFFCPQGQFIHIFKSIPNSVEKNQENKLVWWGEKKYKIGLLTKKVRKVRIINMLSDHEDIIEIPCEETINEILERYKEINEHAGSYTWKRLARPIDMEKSLEENNIIDETDEFERLDIPEDEWYIPAIHLYFNDDLTVA